MALMALSSPAVATTLELTVDGTIYTVERHNSGGASGFVSQYGDQYQSWAWFSDDTSNRTLADALATQWGQGSTTAIRFVYAKEGDTLDYIYVKGSNNIQDDDTTTNSTAVSAYAVQVDARAVPEIDGVVLGQGLLVLSAVGLWGLGRRRERAESMGGA